MDKEQYNRLMELEVKPSIITISGSDLQNQRDRTLLYGYTCDRLTHHVYLKHRVLHLYVHDYDEDPSSIKYVYGSVDIKSLVPDKRLYPEACDYEFCKKLRVYGVYLPFTTWNDKREPKQYYGKIYNGRM